MTVNEGRSGAVGADADEEQEGRETSMSFIEIFSLPFEAHRYDFAKRGNSKREGNPLNQMANTANPR